LDLKTIEPLSKAKLYCRLRYSAFSPNNDSYKTKKKQADKPNKSSTLGAKLHANK
jgi:hypothetical protein